MAATSTPRGGLGDLSWVLNAYAIVYAALLVLFGRLADRYRREHGFLLGVAVFVAASAACGAATSVPMLVAFRVAQAAGAALLTPTSLGLILATFAARAPPRRGPRMDCRRRAGGRARAGRRRPAGGRQLALGVPGQRADRPARAGRRLAAAAARPRPSGAGSRPPGAALSHRRRRRAHARPRQGRSWGWGERPHARGPRGAPGRCVCSQCTAPGTQPADRPCAVPSAAVHGRVGRGAAVLARLRSDAALAGAVGAGRLALVGADTGLAIAPGPIMVPLFSFLLAGRLIARFGPAR